MDRTAFWSLIEETRKESWEDCERQVELLQKRLMKLPLDEVLAFEVILEELMAESYTWELWAAGFIINGGCSDDGFDYFRLWLITLGERVFTSTLKDPDSLADLPGEFPEYAECEALEGVVPDVYEQRTGRELDIPLPPSPTEPRGKQWEEEEVDTVLPRLAARMNVRRSHTG
jgi:hypothetical protein